MPISSNPKTVAVIGAGRMGSALIRALAVAGHSVLAWNRDHAKAKATEAWGAQAPRSLHDAVAPSSYIILCVADYSIALALLDGLDTGTLRGKTVIQLTTGSPDEAAAFATAMEAAGAVSLDGAIMSYPKQVGTPDCRVLFSGSRSVFDDASPTIEALGQLTYIDSNPGSASAMDAALLFYHYGATLSFFQGISLLMASGVDWSRYADLITGSDVMADGLRSLARAIAMQNHQGTDSTLDVHFAALDGVAAAARALEIPREFISAVKAQFEAALKAGHGSDELSAVFEVFRPSVSK